MEGLIRPDPKGRLDAEATGSAAAGWLLKDDGCEGASEMLAELWLWEAAGQRPPPLKSHEDKSSQTLSYLS